MVAAADLPRQRAATLLVAADDEDRRAFARGQPAVAAPMPVEPVIRQTLF